VAKLREVLGGILRDLTESRIVADLAAAEHFDLYQKDPILAHFPVPRMTVKDLTVRLRFAVAGHETKPVTVDLDTVLNRLWRTELAERVLPAVLGTLVRRPLAAERAAALTDALLAPLARTRFGLGDMSAQGLNRAAEVTVARMIAAVGTLPEDARKTLAPERTLRAALSRAVKEHLDAIGPRLRQLSAAHETAQLDLEILVKRADLAGVEETAVQEVTISITTEDVRVAGGPAPDVPEKA
jgi:hypothetical protein